jgi:hypothetical protein
MNQVVVNKIECKQKIYNNNRLIRYTPIIELNNNIVIDNEWFNKQSEKLKKDLYDVFPSMILDDIELPHKDFKEGEIYCKFLHVYKEQYMFDVYEHIFEDCYIVNLTEEERSEIIGLCIQYKIDPSLANCLEEKISNNLFEKIKIQFRKCSKNESIGVFTKTSIKSAKHHKILTPCFSVNDILANLIVSAHVIQSLLFGNCNIILRPWNEHINKNNEFRIYILDKKIKCISQQKLDNICCELDPETIIDSIYKMWNELMKIINYNDCVIDCYVHNGKAEPIEVNSGGCWSTAGSALFNWEEIISLNNVELRLLY